MIIKKLQNGNLYNFDRTINLCFDICILRNLDTTCSFSINVITKLNT